MAKSEIRSSITVSLVEEARGGPFVFWNDLPAACITAQKLGFNAIEIFPPSADALEVKQLAALTAQHDLKIAAFGSGGGWVKHKLRLTDPDKVVRNKAVEFITALLDLAAEFDAAVIVGSLQGRWGDGVSREQAISWLGEGMQKLSAASKERGVKLFYEALNRYETNIFPRQGEAAAFIKSLGVDNVRLLCDLYHMNIEEQSFADTFRALGPMVGHIHFVDSNRQAIGFGHIDMGPIAEALNEIGYTGYLSAECLPVPDSVRAAEQTMRSFQKWFRNR